MSRFANGFENGPVGPRPDCEAVFATAKAVVKNESTRATSRDTNSKATGCLGALDRCAREVDDAVAPDGDCQPLNGIFVQLRLRHGRVRTVSALSVDAIVDECAVNVLGCHPKTIDNINVFAQFYIKPRSVGASQKPVSVIDMEGVSGSIPLPPTSLRSRSE